MFSLHWWWEIQVQFLLLGSLPLLVRGWLFLLLRVSAWTLPSHRSFPKTLPAKGRSPPWSSVLFFVAHICRTPFAVLCKCADEWMHVYEHIVYICCVYVQHMHTYIWNACMHVYVFMYVQVCIVSHISIFHMHACLEVYCMFICVHMHKCIRTLNMCIVNICTHICIVNVHVCVSLFPWWN